ncbi:polyprenyl synthetase family protein [Nocardia sp. BMG51109]|uniref:polyprenyl synthetase family protein n=1 Tax=Nocardia sp. BMG51109 TaxID=1056816 RepID=UPI0004643967|nr:polyprenyl synthetase family protein [Nocardia sp. BMG51109]
MTRTTSSHRPAALLEQARKLCEPTLRDTIFAMPEPLDRMAAYHFGWRDPSGNPTQAGWGKGLRAGLVLAAAAACGADPRAALPGAAAVELVHNFSLVHDDIMDGDRLRRGRATAWAVWGVPAALCLGDTLHAEAIRILVGALPAVPAVDAVTRLEDAAAQLCRGQCEDCSFETRPAVTVDQYVAMAAGKTAALIGCACALGASCAAADAATIDAFGTFGHELGIAFQVTDDILGIWGDPDRTGKPVGNDVIRRKRSFPVVAALESATAAGAELAQLYRSADPITPAQAAHAAKLIADAGGRRRAQQFADRRVAAALAALPDSAGTADLVALTNFIAHRRL